MRCFGILLLLVVAAHTQSIGTRTADEIRSVEASAFDLLSGQVPSHGRAYWEALAESESGLDRGAALLELGRLDEVRELLRAIPATDPQANLALWNLGVIAEREGRLDEAQAMLKRALDGELLIEKELGEIYVQLVQWKGRSFEGGKPWHDYSGMPYDSLSQSAEERVRLDRFLCWTQRFPDTWFERADMASVDDLNLAQVGFVRAADAGHPQHDDWLRSRMSQEPGAIEKAREDLAAAARWVEQFREVEAELLEDALPTYAEVERTMRLRGIRKTLPRDYGLNPPDEQQAIRDAQIEPPVWGIVALLVAAALVVLWIARLIRSSA